MCQFAIKHHGPDYWKISITAMQNGAKNKHAVFLFKAGALEFNHQSVTDISIRPVL
jgi:hypothetical protein